MKVGLYTRPAKPMSITVRRRREKAVVVQDLPAPTIPTLHVSTQCFVTPPDVAARMVEYANLEAGQLVYDPSAGTGNLLQAILEQSEEVILMANELQQSLVEFMRQRFLGQGITLTQGDFLEQTGHCVDRIIMNPPYSKRQAYHHVEHSRRQLADDGVIIACVPVTFKVGGMYEIERLPAGTFSGTGVVTKVVEVVG